MDTNTGTSSIDFSNPYTTKVLNALARRGFANLASISSGVHEGKNIDRRRTDFAVVDVIEKLKKDIPDWCGNKDDCLKVILARMGELRSENHEGLGDNLPYNIVQYVGDAYNTVNSMSDSAETSIDRTKPGRQVNVNPNIQPKPVSKREWSSDNDTVRTPVGSGFEKGGAFGAIKKMNRQDGINKEDENNNNARMNQYTDMWKPSKEMINGVVDRFGYRA